MSTPFGRSPRQYSTAFKQEVLRRLESGEAVSAVARALELPRKIIHEWRAAWRLHGVEGLNRKRGPKPGLRLRRLQAATAPPLDPAPPDSGAAIPSADALAKAEAKIVELERLIGRQQVALDFFKRALQAMGKKSGQPTPVPASTRSSDK